jgi:inner membrane protein
LILATRFRRENSKRALINWIGIAWFCGYILVYTLWHKWTAVNAFEASLKEQGIHYSRIYTNPTIFNNIVWAGTAEGDTAYYFALYGFNDRDRKIKQFSVIPKNHHLMNHIPADDRAARFLRWFSDGYYNVLPYNGDTLQVNDLRFGIMGETLHGNNYVFPFLLFKNEQGEWDVKQNNRNQEHLEENKQSFAELWHRITVGKD